MNQIPYRRHFFKRLGPYALVCIFIYAFALYLVAGEKRTVLPQDALEICLYSNQMGDDLQKTYYDAICTACNSVCCIMYSVSDPYMLHALSTKAELGVDVTLVHDAMASQYVEQKLSKKIHISPIKKRALMHQKLLTIDHTLSFLGSANFTSDSLCQHANLVLAIRSDRVAAVIEEKARLLQEKSVLARAPLFLRNDEQTFELWFLPDDKEALEKLVGLLRSAKKSVRVAMFTFTHPQLIQELVALHHRRVSVQIVLDSESSGKTSRIAFERFKKEKMDVRISARQGLLHEKVAIIDNKILVGGSTNWTKAAFTANDEHIFVLSPLTKKQKEMLKMFWNKTLQEATTA